MKVAIFLPESSKANVYEPCVFGELVDHPGNAAFKAVKLTDGLYFTVTPEGQWRHAPEDSIAGAWQAFQVSTSGSYLIAGRGAQSFTVPYVSFDGPSTP
jgi:hypothetical protein